MAGRLDIDAQTEAQTLTLITMAAVMASCLSKKVAKRGCGIPQATVVRDLDFFRSEARKALEENLLHFIVCKVDKTTGHRQIQRSTEDLWEHKYRFVRYLERTEGKQIFLGRG